MRYYTAVHKYAPILGYQGDMAYVSNRNRWKVNMIRYWNKLLKVDVNRILKCVFDYDTNTCNNNFKCSFANNVKQILCDNGMKANYVNKLPVDLNNLKNLLFQNQMKEWQDHIEHKPKLNFLSSFKSTLGKEKYLMLNISRYEISLLSQLRYGILPLRVETGRFRNEKRDDRLCNMCKNNEIEDEEHFLYKCTFYSEEREQLYNKTKMSNQLNSTEKSKLLFTQYVRQFAKYVKNIYIKRRNCIYK